MSFTPPHTHWRGADPNEWEAAPCTQAPSNAPIDEAATTTPRNGMGRGERIAIVAVTIAMSVIAWWLR